MVRTVKDVLLLVCLRVTGLVSMYAGCELDNGVYTQSIAV